MYIAFAETQGFKTYISTASCTGFSGCNSSRSHKALKSRLESPGICSDPQQSQQIWGGSNPMKKHWFSWVNHGFVMGKSWVCHGLLELWKTNINFLHVERHFVETSPYISLHAAFTCIYILWSGQFQFLCSVLGSSLRSVVQLCQEHPATTSATFVMKNMRWCWYAIVHSHHTCSMLAPLFFDGRLALLCDTCEPAAWLAGNLQSASLTNWSRNSEKGISSASLRPEGCSVSDQMRL